MADDTNLSLLIGQLQGGFREVKQMLLDQNEQHVRDKDAAIQDRDRRHEENKSALKELRDSVDGTAVIARENKNWIATVGNPLVGRVDNIHNRVTALEDKHAEDKGEAKGSAKTWAFIAAVGSGVGGVIAGVAEYGRTGLDFIKSLGHGG